MDILCLTLGFLLLLVAGSLLFSFVGTIYDVFESYLFDKKRKKLDLDRDIKIRYIMRR